MKSRVILLSLIIVAAAAAAATGDISRSETANYNGHEGVTFIRYSRKGVLYNARAWAFKFDLTKGYRIKTWLGASNTPGCAKATLGNMAEALYAQGGGIPIAGINGDYFDNSGVSEAIPTGLVISDSVLVSKGFGHGYSQWQCFLAETGSHNLYHGRLYRTDGVTSGDPDSAWQLTAQGYKVRNAIRTNYCNYPVRRGTINPVSSSYDSTQQFPTTIGNFQDRDSYWRTLVGIGTNAAGVATTLVLFTNETKPLLSFPDVEAYQLMIDEGCDEVGELDGGGSATMWAEAGASASFAGDTTAHGGYVNDPRDGPRAIACGLFVMPPPATPDMVVVNTYNTYPTLEEALLVTRPGNTVDILGDNPRHAVAISDGAGGVMLRWSEDIVFGPVSCAEGAGGGTNGVVAVEVAQIGPQIAGGYHLRMTVSRQSGLVVGTVDQALTGTGIYEFDTTGALRTGAFGRDVFFNCNVELVNPSGEVVPTAATAGALLALRLAKNAPWFSADAATDSASGGAWAAKPPVSDGAFGVSPETPGDFAASTSRNGFPRITLSLSAEGGFASGALPELLATAAAENPRGALVLVEDDNSDRLYLCGLAVEEGGPVWKKLNGLLLAPSGSCRAALDFDLAGGRSRVSYLADAGDGTFIRLQDDSGAVWFDAPGSGSTLAGHISLTGMGGVRSFDGTTPIPLGPWKSTVVFVQ